MPKFLDELRIPYASDYLIVSPTFFVGASLKVIMSNTSYTFHKKIILPLSVLRKIPNFEETTFREGYYYNGIKDYTKMFSINFSRLTEEDIELANFLLSPFTEMKSGEFLLGLYKDETSTYKLISATDIVFNFYASSPTFQIIATNFDGTNHPENKQIITTGMVTWNIQNYE